MGVMACDRTECENIMCNRLIEACGREFYICGECTTELEYHKTTWEPPLSRLQIEEKICEFMDSPKGTFAEKHETEADINKTFDEIMGYNKDDDSEY